MSRPVPQGLYAILDDGCLAEETFPEAVIACFRAGVGCIQLRLKRLTDQMRLHVQQEVLAALSEEMSDTERRLILMVNDRVDLAVMLKNEAAPHIDVGVHLGQEDMPPTMARRILGEDAIIGFSTHTLEQLREAQAFPVDYLGFGPVFPTASKDDTEPVVGISGLAAACTESAYPIIAIGGLDLDKGTQALRAGASAVAMIGALINDSQPGTEEYLDVLARRAAILVKGLQ